MKLNCAVLLDKMKILVEKYLLQLELEYNRSLL